MYEDLNEYHSEVRREIADLEAQQAAARLDLAATIDEQLRDLGIDPATIDHEEPGCPRDLSTFRDAYKSARDNVTRWEIFGL